VEGAVLFTEMSNDERFVEIDGCTVGLYYEIEDWIETQIDKLN
jgi:hypothetical protein